MAVRCLLPMPDDRFSMQPVPYQRGMDLSQYWFEIKWDGWRAFLRWDGKRIQFISRHGKDITGFFPELTRISDSLPPQPLLLDGEVVAFDLKQRPKRGLLRKRGVPRVIKYISFDLLYEGKLLLIDEQLQERRARLCRLAINHPHFEISHVETDSQGKDALIEISKAEGYEGIVAKYPNSRYTCGKASKWWVKFKHKKYPPR